eukprot:763674-Pyramimonas_sp.AAC.1
MEVAAQMAERNDEINTELALTRRQLAEAKDELANRKGEEEADAADEKEAEEADVANQKAAAAAAASAGLAGYTSKLSPLSQSEDKWRLAAGRATAELSRARAKAQRAGEREAAAQREAE